MNSEIMLTNSHSLEASDSLKKEGTSKAKPILDKSPLEFEEAAVVFESILAQIKEEIGIEAYSSWFGSVKLSDYTPEHVKLSVPTTFLRSWLLSHYLPLLLKLWQAEVPTVTRVDILVRNVTRVAHNRANNENEQIDMLSSQAVGSLSNVAPVPNKLITVEAHKSELFAAEDHNMVLGSPLDARYTFDSFIEGSSNRMVFAAARVVAEMAPAAARFNPLFIYASVGLGKTHLLQAIAAEALKRPFMPRVVYLTAEYFMWRFATAIRDNNALSFKEQLRDIDLLIIDDLQFLQGKSIQHEFCHLLNLLLDSAKQVVVAADRPPSELESLEIRIRSRLQGGVSLKIESPDYEMRLQMLRQKAKEAQEDNIAFIPDEALVYVAQSICGSGRDIEGAFNQLVFRQSFESDLSFSRIDELLGHLTRSDGPKRIRIEEIQKVVARHYSVSKQDLLSTRRTRTIVKPRQVAMYLAKVLTPRSLPEIGRRFGGRDHTTVLHAVRKIEELISNDKKVEQELELLKRLIHEQA